MHLLCVPHVFLPLCSSLHLDYPALDRLHPEYQDTAVALLDPSKVDLATAARYTACERFWQRLTSERWTAPPVNVARHGNSWKRAFLELHLAGLIESYVPSPDGANLAALLHEAAAARPFVHSLTVTQMLPQLDLAKVLDGFTHLSSLTVRMGTGSVGMGYDPARQGMPLSGALSIARLLATTRSLLSLTLDENMLTDETTHVLARGLLGSSTLTALSLRHNKIADAGAQTLARVIAAHPTLMSLSLAHNNITETGALALAQALSGASSGSGSNPGAGSYLRTLDLSLNIINDAGAAAVLNAATSSVSLEKLNLAACNAGARSAQVCAST